MKKLSLMLLLAFIAAPAFSQDNGEAAEEPSGIPADFTEYLETTRPGLDPAGEHDIFNLKDPADPDERHEYTQAMLHVIAEYVWTLKMGSTVSKLFDQYSRQQQGNQVTFKVLHAHVLRLHPAGKPNIPAAQKLLQEASEMSADYAYPHYMLAEHEYGRFANMPGQASPSAVLKLLDRALEIRPDFMRAILMKSRVLLSANPPKSEEVREMITPWFRPGKLPQDPDDFENLLALYAESNTRTDLHQRIAELLETGDLTELQRIRAMLMAASAHLKEVELDEAVEDLQKASSIVEPSAFPSEAVTTHEMLALCWRAKANEIRRQDPDDREAFDGFVDAAVIEHERAAEVERKYMPKVLRGRQAREYVTFLSRSLNRHEDALNWLTKYLEENELTGPQRRSLVTLRQNLLNLMNPTEGGLIDLYELHLANDDMNKLAISLGLARENAKLRDEHFRQPRSLKFFIGQVGNRERIIAQSAAFLAADTALQIGHDAVRQAGAAVADRYEEEIELNADRQAELQESLSRTLRDLSGPKAQERAVRHFAKILEESPDVSRMHMNKVLNVWKEEGFLQSLGEHSPGKPGFMDERNPERAAAWLRKLADGLARHADLVHAEWALIDGLTAINRLEPEAYLASHTSPEAATEGLDGELQDELSALRDRFRNIEIVTKEKSPDDDGIVLFTLEIKVKDSDETGDLKVEITRTDDGWKIAGGLAKQLREAMPKPAESDGVDEAESK